MPADLEAGMEACTLLKKNQAVVWRDLDLFTTLILITLARDHEEGVSKEEGHSQKNSITRASFAKLIWKISAYSNLTIQAIPKENYKQAVRINVKKVTKSVEVTWTLKLGHSENSEILSHLSVDLCTTWALQKRKEKQKRLQFWMTVQHLHHPSREDSSNIKEYNHQSLQQMIPLSTLKSYRQC